MLLLALRLPLVLMEPGTWDNSSKPIWKMLCCASEAAVCAEVHHWDKNVYYCTVLCKGLGACFFYIRFSWLSTKLLQSFFFLFNRTHKPFWRFLSPDLLLGFFFQDQTTTREGSLTIPFCTISLDHGVPIPLSCPLLLISPQFSSGFWVWEELMVFISPDISEILPCHAL